MDFHAGIGFSTGRMAKEASVRGGIMSTSLLFQIEKESPFEIGFELGYLKYGSDKTSRRIQINGSWEDATQVLNHNLLLGNAILRYNFKIPDLEKDNVFFLDDVKDD